MYITILKGNEAGKFMYPRDSQENSQENPPINLVSIIR